MNRQQLTRLFIVIAAAAAIVFVPYWAVKLIHPEMAIKSNRDGMLLTWFIGVAMIGISSFIGIMLTFGIIIPIINYIKNGK